MGEKVRPSLEITRTSGLGTSGPDPHAPVPHIEEWARVLERMGAHVTTRVYQGMPHTVNEDELDQVRALMDRVLERPERA